MPQFRFRAIDRNGEEISGVLNAETQDAVVADLHGQGALPIRVEAGASGGLMALLNTEITPRDALSLADLVALTRSMATLLDAGLPLDRALQTIAELGATAPVRRAGGELLTAVREGAALSDALDRQPRVYPAHMRAMVRAGEAGARQAETLAELAEGLETMAKRRGALRSALIYPAFLVLTALGSVALLLGYVVPTFEPLLSDAGVEPPRLTQAVMATGAFVQDWGLVCLGLLLLLALAFRAGLMLPAFRLQWHRVLLRVPVLGRAIADLETARLTGLLGALLTAGVALPRGLGLSADAAGNAVFRQTLSDVTPLVEAGRGLAGPLQEQSPFPPLALQLISVGEESGKLAPMLLKTAEIFDAQSRRTIEQALALITPTLTLVLGLVIAVIIGSILFALFSINELAI